MSSPAISFNYSATVAASVTSGLKGQILIPSTLPQDAGRFVVATTANRGTRRSTCIALENFGAMSTVRVQQVGEIPADVSGLATGAASWVRVSSTGYLERVTTPATGDDVVGRAEADGTVRLLFGVLTDAIANGSAASVADDIAKSAGTTIDRVQGLRGRALASTAPTTGEVYKYDGTEWTPGKPVPPAWFNVCDYGAVGDGVTDDLPAFVAALAAMGSAVSGVARHKVLYVPAGDYYLDGDLQITRAVELRGSAGGGSGYAGSRLVFAPYKGVRIYSWTNAPDRGDAAYAVLKHLDIVGAHNNATADAPHSHAVWQATHAYVAGDKVVAGLSRASRPDNSFEYYFECVKAGTTGGTEPDFTALFNVDQSALWAADTAYYQYNVVRAPNRWDVYFEVYGGSPSGVTQSYRSGPTIPTAFATANVGDLITETGPDGTITWTCRSAEFYFVTDGTAVWACRLAAGVYAQARFTMENCSVRHFLNAGIHVQASYAYKPFSNANGFTVRNVQSHYNGGGLLTRGDEVNASYVYMLDVIGWDQSDRDFGVAERGFLGNRYVACQVASVLGPGYMVTGLSNTGSFIGCYCEGSTGLNDIRPPAFQIIGGTWGTGFTTGSEWTGWTTADDWRGVATKSTFGGRVTRGYNRIDTNSLFGWQADDSAFYERLIYGHSVSGLWDLEWAQSADYVTLSIDGGRGGLGGGALFLPRGFFQGQTDRRLFAPDLGSSKNYRLRRGERNVGDRRQDNTFVATGYTDEVVTSAGYSGPSWAASHAYSCSLRGTLTLYAEVVTPTSANGYAYRCVRSGTTGATEPTWPTVIAAHEFRSWQAGYGVELNDYIRPSTPNGHVYQVTSVGGADSITMATEPTWPTGGGATVVADGITYTEAGADPTTTYVVDGSVIWECCGAEATWSPTSYVTAAPRQHTQAMANANQTLTTTQAQAATIKTTGAITANRDLVLPTPSGDAQVREWTIRNACTGAFSVNVKTSGGASVAVANGKTAIVGIDTTGAYRVTADV